MFGEGTMDFPPIFEALREIGYRGESTSSSAGTATPPPWRFAPQVNSSVRC